MNPPKGLYYIAYMHASDLMSYMMYTITMICYSNLHYYIICVHVGADQTTVYYSSTKTEAGLTTVSSSRKIEPDTDRYLILISGLSVVTIIILIVIIIAMVVALKKYLINNHLVH